MLRSWRRRWLAAVRRRLRPLSVDAGLATEPDAAPAEDSGNDECEEADMADRKTLRDRCDGLECLSLAMTLFGEVRGEDREGKVAAAWAIRHRVERRTWFGKTYRDVCFKRGQFTCYISSPNLAAMDAFPLNVPKAERAAADECLRVAGHVMDAPPEADPICGATHYLTPESYRKKGPDHWSKAPGTEIIKVGVTRKNGKDRGGHYFVRGVR